MATVVQSADGPTEVINARRTESLDAPNILKLVTKATQPQFGLVDVVNIIEKAVLAVTLNNEREEILAHAAFFDYPNVDSVDHGEWQEWLNTYYDTQECTPLNTLFLHYFVAKPAFAHGSAKEIIRTVFNAVPDIHFLYVVLPTGVAPEPALGHNFSSKELKDGDKPLEGYSVFVCHRHDHCPELFVRKARVEDHDDLTPIFNRQSDMLNSTYGSYFLAELIESQDENNQAIIVENEGTAFGFMSLSTDVDVDLLNTCFELGPFHGLRKPHADDILKAQTPLPPEETAVDDEIVSGSQAGSDKAALSRTSSLSSIKKGDTGTAEPTPSTQPPAQTPQQTKATPLPAKAATPMTAKSTPLPTKGTPKPGATPLNKPPTVAGSIAESELQVEGKLSDSHMKSSGSVMSDKDEVESVKSGMSKRSGSIASNHDVAEEAAPSELSVSSEPSLPEPRFEPTYYGPANAFSIQLFCIDERYEMRSQDFLPMAFSLFPDRDFCILTVPHLVPEFPLLQNFVRGTPKCPSVLPQELYLFHRAGLLQSFTVRPACTSDVPAITTLIEGIYNQDVILSDLDRFNKARRDEDGTPIKAFVATCHSQVVGVALTRAEEDIEFIRSHYNIEDFIYFNHHRRDEHGHLHHFAMNPIFQHRSKHFIKEILRQSHHTCLYYPVYPAYSNDMRHSLVTCLNFMVPVRARRQIMYPLEQLGLNAPSNRVIKEQEMYALSHINRKLTLEPKVTINARIVVVGASDTGIAFLETLAFCPHLRFNNLCLISPNGLPGHMSFDETRSLFLSTSHCYTHDELSQISLRSWVNVVSSKMVGINRLSKYVKIANGTKVPYDHLIINTGQQYQVSSPTGADVGKLVTNKEVPNNPDRRYVGPKPKNVFTINDESDAAATIKWLNKRFISAEGKAIIYGSSLDAYTAVQTLLALDVPGHRIAMVQPPQRFTVTCFNNPTVHEAVHHSMAQAGVELYQGYYLAQWNDGKGVSGDGEVYCASFTSDTKPLKLECSAFFCYSRKAVDYEAFKAINDSCLVYDGRLVIDALFHTNDLSIRAAGPLTKFQRKYHAEQWTHANFNPKEVGRSLASTMLRLFDPTIENDVAPPPEPHCLIPLYQGAKVQGGVLPGGLHYLHYGKPGLDMPLEVQMAQADYGREIITVDTQQNYFRLHLNNYSNIQTVTCLSHQPIDVSNLLCLYNIHERFLNNLVSRFDEGLIKDLYAYFRETWSLAIFHDRFTDFRQEVRELLVQRPAVDVSSLEEKVRELISQDLLLESHDRKYLAEQFDQQGNKRAVETRLLSFLSYNYYHLPMYAKPGMV
ncbi:cilia- and flagella-associated protein 61 [Strongylocentrotus purpuratus]|uniref:Cilia- and flagella-associated protein 61 N-terminal domain-containing protein n=1 Tax=Strongylocentrotus purpuratus TaxID=7668 RepID=A0A7M7PPX2_STRPU|nr:cilia- and flagella-associated protein 61 [Strongylocentrotus purpuratus]